jgi:hypothetical protein
MQGLVGMLTSTLIMNINIRMDGFGSERFRSGSGRLGA